MAYPQREDLKFGSGSAGQNLPKRKGFVEEYFYFFSFVSFFVNIMRFLPSSPGHVRDKQGIYEINIYAGADYHLDKLPVS